VAGMVSGSFVVEKVFQIPGLGMYFVNSIPDRDYDVIIGVFVFYVSILVVLNIVVDILVGILDPRSREGR
jgi:oligopeptide transport system permease protein